MQETAPTPPRTQYSILDLLVVVLIFGSHMALMTQHYMAGVDYALGYTCFAIGIALVLFIFAQKKSETVRAHRPAAFFACIFLVFGFFHWAAPSTSSFSPANQVLSKYRLGEALPPGSAVRSSSTSSGSGPYSAEYDSTQHFAAKGLVRGEVLNRIVADVIEKLKANGVSVSGVGSSKGGSGTTWRDSQSFEYSSHGWRGRMKISCSGGSMSGNEPMYTLEIQSTEIRR